MVITPTVYTPVHRGEIIDGDKFQSVSEEVYRKIGFNNNWLIDLRPIGTVVFVQVNQPGASQPDPSIWQECNGSEITNPLSPLRSIGVNQNFVPDLRDRYLRVHDSFVGNPTGGTQSHNLQHTHATGLPSSEGPGLEDDGDRRYRVPHTHTVATQYANPTVIDSPRCIKYIAYMKVV